MLKKLALILACLAVVPMAASAQFIKPLEMTEARNPQVMAELLAVISAAPKLYKNAQGQEFDYAISGIRGGNGSKKPLGQYLVEPSFEFRSDYKKVAPEQMCQFAYDLHEFLKVQGKDWPAMQRDSKLDFLPYAKQKEYAETWWKRNYEPFKHMGWLFTDAFVYDALADGTNVYNWYRRKDFESQSYISWEDSALQELCKKH